MTTSKPDFLISAFRDRKEEQAAIDDLRRAGFTGNRVEVAEHSNDSKVKESVSQALRSRGLPETEARFFQDEFTSGCDLVTVRADGRRAEAEAILHRHGGRLRSGLGPTAALPASTASAVPTATPVREEAKLRPEAGYMPPTAPAAPPAEGMRTVPLKEEELQARKERVEGEAVIRKEVKTEEKTVTVPVQKEELVVERRPVAGSPPAREPMGEQKEIHVPIMEERVKVEKVPVVKEELVVGTKPVEEMKTVSGTVRKEEATVEREGEGVPPKPESERR
jgi:uncharacterized protein (TIGR02271 family)